MFKKLGMPISRFYFEADKNGSNAASATMATLNSVHLFLMFHFNLALCVTAQTELDHHRYRYSPGAELLVLLYRSAFASNGAAAFIPGVIAGPLAQRFPTRPVLVMGAISASFGMISSFMASNVLMLTVSLGVFYGFGNGVIFTLINLTLAQYFDK